MTLSASRDLYILNYKGIKAQTIYGIGRNYAAHAKELNNPVLSEAPLVFMKAPASLRALQAGPLAFPNETFHHEAELVLLIDHFLPMGHQGREEDVAAVTLGLDLTRREIQSQLKAKGHPWTTAKSFAGSALVGEFLPREEVGPLADLSFSLSVNDEHRQTGHTNDMIFSVPTILTYLATLGPLLPGDLIFTGTPEGVGPLKRGDKFQMQLTSNSQQQWRREFAGKL